MRKGCEGREGPFMAVDKTLGMIGGRFALTSVSEDSF